jgi:ectoine hydroxylase-related dioxygenase (phytanoyl-CoA dioxygenase family)
MPLQVLPAASPLPDILAILDADGVVVLEDAVAPSLMDQIADETRPWFERAPVGQDDFRGYKTRRVGALVARSPAFRDLAVHPAVLAVAEAILLPNCTRIQMTYTQAIRLGPGETAQPLHRDDEVYDARPPAGSEWAVILMWAGNDFTAANGATLVVPGSHRWSRTRVAQPEDVVPAVMRKGSALLHLGSVLHAGGANGTRDERFGLSVNYGLGWIRQIENQYLAVPPALARTLPDRLVDLLGYSVHGRIMGEAGLEDPRVAALGHEAEAVRRYEAARGHAVRWTTLSGYAKR